MPTRKESKKPKGDGNRDETKKTIKSIHEVMALTPTLAVDEELDYDDVIYPVRAEIELVGVYLRDGIPTILASVSDFSPNENVAEEAFNALYRPIFDLIRRSIPKARFSIHLIQYWSEVEEIEGLKTYAQTTE